MTIPTVIDADGRGWDIYSRLLKDRIIVIGTNFNDAMASSIIAQLLLLQAEDPKKDIHIYINSGGGSVTAGLAIFDTINMMSCDVNTYCMGMCASMATVILSAGTKGKRNILKNAHTMVHQVSGGAQGTAADVERTVEFMYSLRKRLNVILANSTGNTVKQMEKYCDRDYYMSAEESVEFGLVDNIL
jgi:ATP-dependent Clp protease, protease subunit